jgi:hypothetical protein
MPRRTPDRPTDDAARAPADPAAPPAPGPGPDDAPERPGEPDLKALPIAGITRRRLAMVMGGVLAMWIVVVFARQVSEAAAATSRAEAMVGSNAARKTEIESLERELDRIQQPRYILQQARGYGLGGTHEIPFTVRSAATRRRPGGQSAGALADDPLRPGRLIGG